MWNKRGISAVVATVLIILITVAAVSIVWVAVVPIIKDNLEMGTVCLEADVLIDAGSGYTCYDAEKKIVAVQVKKGASEVDISKVEFLLDSEGSSKKITMPFGLGSNIGKVFYISVSADAEEVSVAPVIKIGDKEKSCDVSAKVKLSECSLSSFNIDSVSCLDWLNQGNGEDDVYWIDPDGSEGENPFQVYCDMTTDGGGWTFFAHVNSNCGSDGLCDDLFTEDKGSYRIDRNDDGTTYGKGILDELEDTEMMVTLDNADPVTADGNNKIVFYRYDKEHAGFNNGPLPCIGLTTLFEYKTQIGGSYTSGGTSNGCGNDRWYPRTVGNSAYLALFLKIDARGNYWGSGMGGDNSWNHDGWWYVR